MSDDLVDMHLLSLRLPGQAASFRSLQRRLLHGRTPRPAHILADAEKVLCQVPRPRACVTFTFQTKLAR